MGTSTFSDPAERSPLLRFFYRGWRPTYAGRWANRFAAWLTELGIAGIHMAVLEVRGRASGRPRTSPVVVATFEGQRYLVSMLGPGSGWVKNVKAARGEAFLRQRGRRAVQLVPLAPPQRAPVLREYVRVATSGRQHLPVAIDAPLAEFEAIADRYPVYRIDPRPR
jgi:deazaflavin-dependent oxidoreductase (nitroreductase family)